MCIAERRVIAIDEIIEYLTTYERARIRTRGFVKRVHASIEKIKKHIILQKIRGAEDRFEISPTLKAAFSGRDSGIDPRVQGHNGGDSDSAGVGSERDEDADEQCTAEPTLPMFAQEQFACADCRSTTGARSREYMTIPVSERGFLFVGPSALANPPSSMPFSALLVPPRWSTSTPPPVRPSAAAADSRLRELRSRSVGRSEDIDSGEIATQYLRPSTTWSALSLSYENALNRVSCSFTCVDARNSTATTDVNTTTDIRTAVDSA